MSNEDYDEFIYNTHIACERLITNAKTVIDLIRSDDLSHMTTISLSMMEDMRKVLQFSRECEDHQGLCSAHAGIHQAVNDILDLFRLPYLSEKERERLTPISQMDHQFEDLFG